MADHWKTLVHTLCFKKDLSRWLAYVAYGINDHSERQNIVTRSTWAAAGLSWFHSTSGETMAWFGNVCL